MRRPVVIAIRIGYLLVLVLIVLLVYPMLRKPKAYSGPGPRGMVRRNLLMIEDGKRNLKESQHRPDDYWPTRAEVASAYTGNSNTSFDALMKPTRWGEVYVVNQIGAPAYAYFSNAVADFPEGFLLTLRYLEDGAQPQHSADESQPFKSGTSPASAAAGSHR